MSTKPLLIIIDAPAVLHRAWHALPKLTDPRGRVINAVYGFSSLLLKLVREQKPNYLAAAFDTKAPTFRHLKYKEYKAGREKQPQEFYDQIPLAKQIAQGFAIPTFSLDGYEADDLIAAIIKGQKQEIAGLKSLIVTGDLDLLQLVDKQTSLYFLRQGLSQIKIYGPDEIKERFGLSPKQLIDFKALRGDASDNIKGVPGIGEKNALDLIKKFKNLENIYAHLEKNKEENLIKKNIAEILRKNKERAILTKELVTIKQKIEKLNFKKIMPFDAACFQTAIPTLKEFGFKSLIKRLEENISSPNKLF